MVARLQEGETAQLAKRAILHFISQSVCMCVFVPECHPTGVRMRICVFRFDEEQNELELAALLGHVRKKNSRDAGKYSRSSAGWKDCNQTINQKSLNCHPPAPSLSLSLLFFFVTTLFSAELPSMLHVTYSHALTALEEVNSRSMKNAFSLYQTFHEIPETKKNPIFLFHKNDFFL